VATVHAGREEQFDTQQAANAGPEEECDGGDERTRAAVRYAAPPPRAGLSKRACAKSDLSAVPLNTTSSVVYTPFKRPRVSANDQEHEQQEQEHELEARREKERKQSEEVEVPIHVPKQVVVEYR
jgi:hypothetical protein